jgi:hypothetical protein
MTWPTHRRTKPREVHRPGLETIQWPLTPSPPSCRNNTISGPRRLTESILGGVPVLATSHAESIRIEDHNRRPFLKVEDLSEQPLKGTAAHAMTGVRILCMATKYGIIVLYHMPNRTNCILLVPDMTAECTPCAGPQGLRAGCMIEALID